MIHTAYIILNTITFIGFATLVKEFEHSKLYYRQLMVIMVYLVNALLLSLASCSASRVLVQVLYSRFISSFHLQMHQLGFLFLSISSPERSTAHGINGQNKEKRQCIFKKEKVASKTSRTNIHQSQTRLGNKRLMGCEYVRSQIYYEN